MIPCKECITYPVCRYKLYVDCDQFHEWLTSNQTDLNLRIVKQLYPTVYRIFLVNAKRGRRIIFLHLEALKEDMVEEFAVVNL